MPSNDLTFLLNSITYLKELNIKEKNNQFSFSGVS